MPQKINYSGQALYKWITNIHVFHWWPNYNSRHLLQDGFGNWQTYLSEFAISGKDRFALLEFVKDDSIENFKKDAATLKELLKGINEV